MNEDKLKLLEKETLDLLKRLEEEALDLRKAADALWDAGDKARSSRLHEQAATIEDKVKELRKKI